MAGPDITAALRQYGYVGSLANSVPELRELLKRAAAQKWDMNEFARALQDSKWWKTQSDAVKQYTVTRSTKPGEFVEQQRNVTRKIQAIAAQLGVSLLHGGNHLPGLVQGAMMHGWDEDTLRQEIGKLWAFSKGREPVGQAGTYAQQIRQLYNEYGLGYTSNTIAKLLRGVMAGQSTMDTVKAGVLQAAKSTYAGLVPQLDQGQTVKDVADQYTQQMSQILELPPERVTVMTPRVQQALQYKGADGKPASMPLWQFQQSLRTDPRWDKTKNATDAAYGILGNIKEKWGF